METDKKTLSLYESLIGKSDKIFEEYYSTMPLLRIGGGIDYEIKSALGALSTFTIPTKERCELYLAINSEILLYLQRNNGDLTNVYQHNKQLTIGSGIGIEQLFANDITNNIISALVGATIPLLEPLKEILRNKIISILKRKTKNQIDRKELENHAVKMVLHIVNSEKVNVKLNININKSKLKLKRPSKKQSNHMLCCLHQHILSLFVLYLQMTGYHMAYLVISSELDTHQQ